MIIVSLSSDNVITHQLQFKPVGSNRVVNYNLSTLTELKLEFYSNTHLVKTLSNLTHTGVQIEDPIKGVVSYKPFQNDFTVSEMRLIKFMNWKVINPENTLGLVFNKPYLGVKVTP